MYNKLFTKILDSSIWLESSPTRIVWLTFIAMMDEHGFVQLAAVGNVAARARVSVAAAQTAIEILEAPDKESSDQDHEGRRIERVPGGWMVLNAQKYRDLVTRVVVQAQTRERVRRHRERKRSRNAQVTRSEAEAYTDTDTRSEEGSRKDQDQRADAPNSYRVLLKIAHEVLEIPDSKGQPDSELLARLKDLAAQRDIPYNSRIAAQAMDAACHQHVHE